MGFVSNFTGSFTKRLDAAILSIDPQRAERRQQSRIRHDVWKETGHLAVEARRRALEIQLNSGAYRGGTVDRTSSEWNPQIGDANADSLDDLPTLRARCSDLVRNDGLGSGVIETEVSNVVGTGFKAEPIVDFEALGISQEKAEKIGEEMKRVWRHWQPWADVSNHLDFREMQQVILRGILERGDIFLVRRVKTDGRRPLGFCWQLVEADRVDTGSFQNEGKNPETGNSISAGVEVDSDGAPVAYWILKDHPGADSWSWAWENAEEKDVERIPAFDDEGRPNVLHLYFQKRPGQTRGVPLFAPVILYFQQLGSYMEAELIAQRVAACFGLIFNETGMGDGTGRATGPTITDSAGRAIESLEPGMMANTYNTEVHQVKAERPGDQFDPFVARCIRTICAGVGQPYELVAKDFSKSNYSNMRAALLEARRMFEMYQAYLGREACQPSWDLVMEEAFVRGMWGKSIKNFFSRKRDYLWVKWIPNGWKWIDPPREVKAAVTAIENNLTSAAEDTASRGGDHDEILRSNANTKRKQRELGLRNVAEEIKVSKMLRDTGVAVSIENEQKTFFREAPKSEEDSTVKPEETPTPNGDNPDGDDADE